MKILHFAALVLMSGLSLMGASIGGISIENGGVPFLLPGGENIALLGFRDTVVGSTVTASDVDSLILSGGSSVLGYFNGLATDNGTYAGGTLDPFTAFSVSSVDRASDNKVFEGVYMVYSAGTNVVFRARANGGTATAGQGTRDFPGADPTSPVPEPSAVPEPGSIALLSAGAATLVFLKRRS
ncbi:MAG: PEP-CTERM sorting domain-containing protein [Bryobacteraceae bacterium]|nr:PEP-CTERM sorting domain-containing protein [Bryobacteraceae bacterium]